MPTVLGFVWTLPNTLIGVVLGLLTFQMPRIAGGALVFDRSPRGLSWFLSKINRVAMTVGFVIISAEPVEGVLLAHERHHIRQYMAWGPLFIPAYLLAFAVRGYDRHPFELAAKQAAGEVPASTSGAADAAGAPARGRLTGMRQRHEIWGDDAEEREAEATVSEFAQDVDVQRKWHDHPGVVPFKVVVRFIGRNGKRIGVTIAGFAVMLVGLVLVPLPGPGWLIVFLGLTILATEYVWAQRLLNFAKQKVGQAKDAVLGKKHEEPDTES